MPSATKDQKSAETRSNKTVAKSAVGRSVHRFTGNLEEADIEVVNLASGSDTQRPKVPDSGSFQSLTRLRSSISKSSPVRLKASRTTNPSNLREQQQQHSIPSNIEAGGSLIDNISNDYDDSWLDDLPSPSLLLNRGQAEQDAPNYELAEKSCLHNEALDPNTIVLPKDKELPANSHEQQWMDAPGSPAVRLKRPWKSSMRHRTAKKAKRQSPSVNSSPSSTSSGCLSDETSYEGHNGHDVVTVENRQRFDEALLGSGHLLDNDASIKQLHPPVREALEGLSPNEERVTWVDSTPTKDRKLDNSGSYEEDDLGAVSASKSERQLPHGLKLPWDDLTGLDLEFLAEIADIVEFV